MQTLTDCFRVTAPREILPGHTYLVTRRCTQRQFLLTPSKRTNEIISFSLALAAFQTGVVLHAYCFMSNHWHGVVTDPHARLPEFIERFHRLVARAQNEALQRQENLWSTEKTSVVALVSAADILEKMAYTLANPTSARLVRSPSEWPGVISTHRARDRQVVPRPDVFFDGRGSLPKSVVLETTRPLAYAQLSDLDFAKLLLVATTKLVKQARKSADADGTGFVGAGTVLRQSSFARPKTRQQRGKLHPRLAAKSRLLRVGAITSMLSFVRAYRDALLRWRDGFREVLFPRGTYAIRVYHGANCSVA